MATQLEIINPRGEISFYDLDAMHKIVNIGSDPENDVVLAGSNIPPFCVMLDCRQYPVQLVVLSDQGTSKLNGEVIVPNAPVTVEHWGTIELDGYTLVLLQGETLGQVAATSDRVSPATRPPVAEVRVAPVAAGSESLMFDETDDLIVVEMATREWTVDVEHSVTTQITLINGGRVVADFDVQVHGLDPSWVEISSPRISLYEGGRGVVAISISPPREPSSRAGEYHFAVVVTSPNYPGHVSRTTARLTINPYYEFSVSELEPKKQSVSWSRQTAQTFFSLTNLGNSRTAFILEGKDDDRACQFEFQVPGQSALQTGQVGIHLVPDETLTVPIYVTPVDRKLIGLGKRKFSYNITASLPAAEQMSCTVMGQIKSAPLFGPFHVFAFLFCLCALIVFLFMPNPQPELKAVPAFLDEPGKRVQLYYNASRFSGLKSSHLLNRLNSAFLKIRLEHRAENSAEWQTLETFKSQDTSRSAGEFSLVPYSAAQYRLWTRTWIPFIEGWSEEVTVFVKPVQPVITFTVQNNSIIAGQNAVLQWQVRYAESLTLEYPGVQENLPADQLERGQISLPLDRTTTFTLIAANSSGSAPSKKSLTVQVMYPTPSVIQFNVSPNIVTLGESVNLAWDVSGADKVTIEGVGDVGLKGSTTDQPTEYHRYTLRASYTGADGTVVESQPVFRDVYVHTPTPTPAPPVIDIFDVVPKQVVLGGNQVVNLRWNVSGQTTNVEITAPNLKLSGLDPKDPDGLDITVDKTTLFILTAYNGERSVSASVEVSAIEPTPTNTPTPTATPTATPTPTSTPDPLPKIVSFIAQGDKVGNDTWSETENGPLRVYPVEAGSPFVLEWKVVDAEQVILVGMGGPRSHEGSFKELGLTENKTYQLTAENKAGVKVNAFIRMEVYLPPPPPAPSNLTGTVLTSTNGISLTWTYPSAAQSSVSGFRVYRADSRDQRFENVAFVEVRPVNLPLIRYYYFDDLQSQNVCGKAYYVVAVYHDIIANKDRETDASLNSWYSMPCLP